MYCQTLQTGRLLIIGLSIVSTVVPRVPAADRKEAPQERTIEAGYVGSASCAGCHTRIFQTWQSTRHGYSVLTGGEAEDAGYPLPERRRGGEAPTVTSWGDVAYVIGGRQRISYVNRSGQVEGTSYHHRTGRWDGFPRGRLEDCGPCHFTGFGVGDAHPDDSALPGHWVERNIGCETCHGPGERHVKTYDKEDILVDPSSRSCGECHTAAGRVLPTDDLHETHDLVQTWNQDPHATGVRFHSHNAFCSRCHSPYDGHFLESRHGARKRVFTEHKLNITCIACHNPHDLTNAHYRRETVSLGRPLPSRRQTYRGNDEDFTTTDFKSFETTEQVCVECHTGADRIDLDHAHATCNDCHNTFHRNRSLESRVFHDANHRGLSCRPCHQDADHLLSILFGDPDFLEPKYVHNLRTLPGEVIGRYGFKYPGLRSTLDAVERIETSRHRSDDDPPAVAPASGSRTTSRHERTRARLRSLLERTPHRQIAEEAESTRSAHAALAADPEAVGRYVELARVYGRRAEYSAAHDVLKLAASLDSTRILMDLPFDSAPPPDAATDHQSAPAIAEMILPSARVKDADQIRSWVTGYLEMTKGRFSAAAQIFATALSVHESAVLEFYLGLAELGRRKHRDAVAPLEAVLKKQPAHLGARVALGFVQQKRRRFNRAREELLQAVATDPHDPVAHYLLGSGYLNQRDVQRAVGAFRSALAADPSLIDARFALARAYRLGGLPGDAAETYREIIRLLPDDFHAHFQLAGLFKELSDKTTFRLRGEIESAAPPGGTSRQWRQYLSELEAQAMEYGRFALSEFTFALRIRPYDLESVRQVGEIYRRGGRQEEAQRVFEWLTHRQGGVWRYPYRLGTILLERKRYSEAIATLERVRALSPADGDTYFALGIAYLREARLVEAIETFRQGIIYEPFNPGLHTNLGAAYASREEFSLARRALERALELDTFPLPRTHLTLTNLALVHLREERYDKAVPRLKEALHLFPEYAYARHLLEKLRVTTGQERRAAFDGEPFVFNDLLEIFGEVTTIAFEQ